MFIKSKIKNSPRLYNSYLKFRYEMNLWKDSFQHIYLNRIISNFPSHRIRLVLLRIAGAKIAKNAAIHSGCTFWNPKGLIIEEGSVVGFKCNLDARRGLKIGKNVCIASEVMIWSLHHDYNSPVFDGAGGLVEIGDYSWLCSRCIILPNLKVEKYNIIASGAVLTKNTLPFSIMGGIPAKKIGERDNTCDYSYVPSTYKLHIV